MRTPLSLRPAVARVAVVGLLVLFAACSDPPQGLPPATTDQGLLEFPLGDAALPDAATSDNAVDSSDQGTADPGSADQVVSPDLPAEQGGPDNAVTQDAPAPDTAPDLPPDVGPDLPPDVASDLAPDLAEDVAPDLPIEVDTGPPPGTPLDPNLKVPPDGEGELCQTPGSSGECPFLQVCRPKTAEYGQCESCEIQGGCANLGGFCDESYDCDILFTCYLNKCANICPLGTFYCGPIEDCLNIGHPTHGVCKP